MKKCELCGSAARMFCDSDQASLCWDCDSRVHTANFIVTKHTRTLLCHVCQSLTPWTGSGPRLGPTVSVCPSCLSSTGPNRLRNANTTEDASAHGNDDHDESHHDNDDGNHEEEHDDDDDDDDGENQVVPLSLPPSFRTSSSSSGETSIDTRNEPVPGSGFGSFHPTGGNVEGTIFSYSSVERPVEKRSWTWRW